MKYIKVILFLLIKTSIVFSQQVNDFLVIKNYQNSTIFAIQISDKKNIETFKYNDFGESQHSTKSVDFAQRYLFQTQELDKELNLIFFQSRIYTPLNKKFLQPDPNSQYHSPYLMVASDPINYIDLNGAQGKPIVFYHEETGDLFEGIDIPFSIMGMQDIGVDAYYLPADALVDGLPLPKMEEWNGNVFIHGHCNLQGDFTIESRANSRNVDFNFQGDGKAAKLSVLEGEEMSYLVTEPEVMAENLMSMSVQMGIPLENVTIDGCQSTVVAQRLSGRFQELMPDYIQQDFKQKPTKQITTRGYKKGNYATWRGPIQEEADHPNFKPENSISIHGGPKDEEIIHEQDENGEFTSRRLMVNQQGELQEGIQGRTQISDYSNGILSANSDPLYDKYIVPY